MSAPRINLRPSKELYSALAKRAGEQPIGTYAVSVLAKHCGIDFEPYAGFASLSAKEVRRIQQLGIKAKKSSRRKSLSHKQNGNRSKESLEK